MATKLDLAVCITMMVFIIGQSSGLFKEGDDYPMKYRHCKWNCYDALTDGVQNCKVETCNDMLDQLEKSPVYLYFLQCLEGTYDESMYKICMDDLIAAANVECPDYLDGIFDMIHARRYSTCLKNCGQKHSDERWRSPCERKNCDSSKRNIYYRLKYCVALEDHVVKKATQETRRCLLLESKTAQKLFQCKAYCVEDYGSQSAEWRKCVEMCPYEALDFFTRYYDPRSCPQYVSLD